LVAHLLAADGHDVTLVTALSDDGASHELRRQLSDVHVVPGFLDAPTPVKTRVLRDGAVVARVDEGCGSAPLPRVTPAMLSAVQTADALVVADYGRGMAAIDLLRTAITQATTRIPVIWDPHPRGPAPVPGVTAVTPNRLEAAQLAGVGHDEPGRAARKLRADWRARNVVVTLGEEGAWLQWGPNIEDGRRIPASAVAAADACGAGDRFAAALAGALTTDPDLPRAVFDAVAVTGRFLAEGGVRTLSAPRRRIGSAGHDAAQRGPDAIDVIRQVHEAGGIVVATGGCFDLLHVGHLQTLRAARARGDALVVCLNSDDSVRRLKGPTRPLMSQQDRAELLLALDCVDAVVVFDEDTPLAVLDLLRPDVWVKGGDYIAELLPEHELVASWGGVVQTVPFLPGRSTTALVTALEGPADATDSETINK
jgi:rfaE bifunctional protein nucleotidyltransferase chain/domain